MDISKAAVNGRRARRYGRNAAMSIDMWMDMPIDPIDPSSAHCRLRRPRRASANGAQWRSTRSGQSPFERQFGGIANDPPKAWAQADPADSLYRLAREALNHGEYRRAAQLFGDISQRFPSSAYAADAGTGARSRSIGSAARATCATRSLRSRTPRCLTVTRPCGPMRRRWPRVFAALWQCREIRRRERRLTARRQTPGRRATVKTSRYASRRSTRSGRLIPQRLLQSCVAFWRAATIAPQVSGVPHSGFSADGPTQKRPAS